MVSISPVTDPARNKNGSGSDIDRINADRWRASVDYGMYNDTSRTVTASSNDCAASFLVAVNPRYFIVPVVPKLTCNQRDGSL